MEVLCKLIPLIFMKYSKLPFTEFTITGSSDTQILTSIEEMLFNIDKE
jgi:hypothetical protein